jgi:microcystin-dependent protein
MAKTALRRGSQDEGNSEYFTGCPIGGGFMWFGLITKIPANCRVCDNSTLAIASFAKLNENLGGAWGTSGGNLNIPDLRGKFPRGVDGGAANDPDRVARTAANTGGNTGDAVGSVQADAMQGHKHPFELDTGTVFQGSLGAGSNSTQFAKGNGTPNGTVQPTHGYPIADAVNGTPRTTSETRPKNANVYFVIRVS